MTLQQTNPTKRRRVLIERGIVAGNVYDKYGSRNPVVRRLMRGFLTAFTDLVGQAACSDVHEVGCGEGHLSTLLSQLGMHVRASDFSSQMIDEARRNAQRAKASVRFKVADVADLVPDNDSAELIVCCEVLEHLDQPLRALRILSSLARPYLLVSVPREPIWRVLNLVRGRYLAALGNTPGHVNHWSTRAFLQFLDLHVDVVALRKPFPWTMALCRSRAAMDGTGA